MGSKIEKIKYHLTAILVCFCLIFITNGVFAAQSINPLVRVAISNNNFKTFNYNEISIIATSEFGLYDKATAMPIVKFLPQDIAKLKYKNGVFEVFVNDKSVAKDIEGILVFDCRDGVLGVEKLKRRSKQALYHGIFEVVPKNQSEFYLVNVLDLQEYLKGVVPNEMPVRFGLEALKAQAVAARNYVLMPRTKVFKEFDVDDSVSSQVYFGANTEDALATKAVNETQGLIAMFNSKLILAQYCSTAGGYTEDWHNAFPDYKSKTFFMTNSKPYLKGRPDILLVKPLDSEEAAREFYTSCPDSYDIKSPYYRWKKEYSLVEINDFLPKMLLNQSKTGFVLPKFEQGKDFGELRDIKVLKRGVSGKIMELQIISTKGSWIISKELVIRRMFPKNGISLPSANVVFDLNKDSAGKILSLTATGGGFGHGVGMSQFGAGFMACELKKSFDKILKRYYTGISISTIPVRISANTGQKIAQVQFFAPYKKATLVIHNPYHVKDFDVNINNVDILIPADVNFLNKEQRIDVSKYIIKGINEAEFIFSTEEKNKYLDIYIELVEKDDNEYNF